MVAGQRKNVLFSANTLLDLLQTGAAKIYNNVRRRATEYEKSESGIYMQNYQINRVENHNYGWQRIETGRGVGYFGDNIKNREYWKIKENGQDGHRDRFQFNPSDNLEWGKTDIYVGNRPPRDPLAPVYFGFESFNNLEQNTYSQNLLNLDKGLRAQIDARTPGFLIADDVSVLFNPLGHFATWAGIEPPSIVFPFLNLQLVLPPNYINLWALNDYVKSHIGSSIDMGQIDILMGNFLGHFLNSVGISVQPVGLGLTWAIPAYAHSISHIYNAGRSGNVNKVASKKGFSYDQNLNTGFNENKSISYIDESSSKRIITHEEVMFADKERVRGGETMWQGKLVDIVTGTIPLNFTLPATASKMYRTSDDSLRVKLGNGLGIVEKRTYKDPRGEEHSYEYTPLTLDIWFDVIEEEVRDDY